MRRLVISLVLFPTIAAVPMRGESVVALSFDGKNDAVEISSAPVLGSTFTEEALILPQSKDTGYHGIVGNNSQSHKRAPGLWLAYGAGIHGGFGDGKNWNSVASAPDVLVLDAWNHVAATYDGRVYRVYANGIEVATKKFDVTPLEQAVTHIGNVSSHFYGAIREVRLWNRALPANEIERRMTQTLSGREEGLVACFPFDDGAGTTARNSAAPTSLGSLKNGPRWTISSAPVAPLLADPQLRAARKMVKAFSPNGDNVAPDAPIEVKLRDGGNLDAKFVRLLVDNADVEREVNDEKGELLLRYEPARPYAPASEHTVKVSFVMTVPTRKTNEFSYRFTVTSSVVLSK